MYILRSIDSDTDVGVVNCDTKVNYTGLQPAVLRLLLVNNWEVSSRYFILLFIYPHKYIVECLMVD